MLITLCLMLAKERASNEQKIREHSIEKKANQKLINEIMKKVMLLILLAH